MIDGETVRHVYSINQRFWSLEATFGVEIFLSLYRGIILISLNRISIKFLWREMELQGIENRQFLKKINNNNSLLPLRDN